MMARDEQGLLISALSLMVTLCRRISPKIFDEL